MTTVTHKRFYVYTLTEPTGKIFYVGKGQKYRIHQHEAEARKNCACHKCRKIRKVWRSNKEIGKLIVFETDDESEAYEQEAKLIAEIGMKNLCNKTLGGSGTRTVIRLTPEQSEALDNYWKELKEREKIEKRQRASADRGWERIYKLQAEREKIERLEPKARQKAEEKIRQRELKRGLKEN